MTAKRPTILQIIPELDTGGAELSAIEIAEAVAGAGGRCLVLTEGGRLAPRISACGGELITFPAATKNPAKLLWNAVRIARLVKRSGVDLIHARSRAPAWSALLAARLTGRPFVTTYHGAYGEQTRLKRLYNSIMAKGDAVIANSRYTAELIRERYGTPEKRIWIIPRGVDGRDYDPAAVTPERTEALRRAWGIGAGDRVVLQAARLTGWKGQRILIEAARLLAARDGLSNVAIILAGSEQGRGGYRLKLEKLIVNGGLGQLVRLVGHVEDMPATFRLAHVAVIASTEPEAFGRTATEAQAMGCPVIATDHGAPPETILARSKAGPEAATGWLVPPGDANQLSVAISESLALSPSQRDEMGRRARTHALACFSLRDMRLATLEVYDRLIGSTLAAEFRSRKEATIPGPRA